MSLQYEIVEYVLVAKWKHGLSEWVVLKKRLRVTG